MSIFVPFEQNPTELTRFCLQSILSTEEMTALNPSLETT